MCIEKERLILFVKYFGEIILMFLWFTFPLCLIYFKFPPVLSIIGIIAYFIKAHQFTEYCATNMWTYLLDKEQRHVHKLTATLGYLDRAIYASCFVLNKYSFIAIWLGIKIASRLVGYTDIKERRDLWEDGERRNAFLIGNTISLVLGILGGILIKMLATSYFPSALQLVLDYL